MMMRSRQIGASFWDFLIFVLLIGGVALGVNFFMRKPAVVAPAPVVVQPVVTPSAPVVEEPATRPIAPVVVAAPAPAPQPIIAAYVAPPPPAECVAIEERLRATEGVVAQGRLDLAAAKKSCLDQLAQTADYQQAKGDLNLKVQAKEAAGDKLTRDGLLSTDADQDAQDKKAATQDWIAAAGKVTAMENDALAADPMIGEKERIVKGASAEVMHLRGQLNDYVAKAITEDAQDENCPLGAVKLDIGTWTINTEVKPKKQAEAGAMADAAMNEIGRILQKTLCRSAFTWDTAKFTVFGDYKGKKAVEFQAVYLRSEVDQMKLVTTRGEYFDDQALVNLARGFWVSPVIEQMQGGKTKHATGEVPPHGQKWLTLTIGGCMRADGSACPIVYVRCAEDEDRPGSYTAIIPGRSPMPALYRDHPLDPMGPPLDDSRP